MVLITQLSLPYYPLYLGLPPTLYPARVWGPGALGPGALGPWGPGALGPWGPGFWGPGALGCWGPGALGRVEGVVEQPTLSPRPS